MAKIRFYLFRSYDFTISFEAHHHIALHVAGYFEIERAVVGV